MTQKQILRFFSLAFMAFFATIVFVEVGGLTSKANAQTGEHLYIKIGEANVKKSLIAVPPLQYLGTPGVSSHLTVGKTLYDTLFNDLSVSSYFEFIRPDAYLEDTSKVGLKPAPGVPGGFNFENWKSIGSEFLVRAGYNVIGGQLSVEAYLYYVPQAKAVFGKTYKAGVSDVRILAHTFANDIVNALTGKKGIFLTKIVASRSTKSGQKEIFVMDWDGQNAKSVTAHKSIAISPAWSPNGETIAYTAFAYHKNQKKRNADLFSYNLKTGKRWLVSYREGINSGASFFPDGRHMLLTVSRGGNPDIYKMTLDGNSLSRITNGPRGAMNVEPAVSPDGKRIAFSSDRSGRPMLYVMTTEGTNIKRLTFAGEYNSTPVWSPDGKKIAFAGFDKGHFDIFVMDADGTNMARLTSAKKANGKMANNESPSFSPDGRHVLFASDRTGTPQLYVVNVDGSNERRLTFDRFSYFQPRWSPYLD